MIGMQERGDCSTWPSWVEAASMMELSFAAGAAHIVSEKGRFHQQQRHHHRQCSVKFGGPTDQHCSVRPHLTPRRTRRLRGAQHRAAADA